MPQNLIILTIVAFAIFLLSFDFAKINSYSLLMTGIFGLVFYFGFEHILKMFKSGRSILSIVIFIIVVMIISSFGWAGYMVYTNKQKINKQWPQYRCKPYIIPFAGWAIGPSGISGTDNFTNCMWSINKSFFDILMSPFVDMMKIIVNILSSLTQDVQNIRKIVTYMRGSIEEIAKDVNSKIWDAYYRISYLFKIILKTFAQLGTVFRDLFEVLTYTFYTMASLWNGPIGGVSSFFCFDRFTCLKLNDGCIKYIKDIKPGNILENNNGVLGILKFDSCNTEMYCYKGSVIVSGEHLVNENGKWIRVCKSEHSTPIDNYYNDRIYCLITEDGNIRTNGIEFSDYNETNDRVITRNIYNFILAKLNKNHVPINYNINIQSGLSSNTKVLMKDNSLKKIKDIRIGDRVMHHGRVLAKTKILPNNIYKYKNVLLSGNSIVHYYGEWKPVSQIIEATNVDYNGFMYHIITEDNMVNIDNGILIRDFEQMSEVNQQIDDYIDYKLNN